MNGRVKGVYTDPKTKQKHEIYNEPDRGVIFYDHPVTVEKKVVLFDGDEFKFKERYWEGMSLTGSGEFQHFEDENGVRYSFNNRAIQRIESKTVASERRWSESVHSSADGCVMPEKILEAAR